MTPGFGPLRTLRRPSEDDVRSAFGPSRGVELFLVEARRDGDRVATLRLLPGSSGYVVECDVVPVGGRPGESQHPGPYAFASEREARAFVDEASTALQYLGCEISES